jgi:hypothetical protein
VFAPPLDQDLRFAERVEHLGPQQLVAQLCSVTPIDRTASATDLPCAASTSTCRSLATISSGVCAFFLPIHEPPFASAAHIAGGPLLGGQVTANLPERSAEIFIILMFEKSITPLPDVLIACALADHGRDSRLVDQMSESDGKCSKKR